MPKHVCMSVNMHLDLAVLVYEAACGVIQCAHLVIL